MKWEIRRCSAACREGGRTCRGSGAGAGGLPPFSPEPVPRHHGLCVCTRLRLGLVCFVWREGHVVRCRDAGRSGSGEYSGDLIPPVKKGPRGHGLVDVLSCFHQLSRGFHPISVRQSIQSLSVSDLPSCSKSLLFHVGFRRQIYSAG